MRTVNLIVIHCAATSPDMDIGAADIRRWHVDGNKWDDIGYHYVIRRNGAIEPGRPVEKPGAHVRGHNANSIGVCLVGGSDADDKAKAEFNFTRRQMHSMTGLVESLRFKYPGAMVTGHCNLDPAKACPVFDVKSWFED